MKHFTLLFLAVVLSVACLQAQDEYLLGRWDFEEGSGTSVEDLSGNYHTGTVIGNTEFSDDAVVGDYSIRLHRENGEGVRVGTINLGDQFTICAWVKVPTGSNNIQLIFANYPGDVPGDGFALMINEYPTTDKTVFVYNGTDTDFLNAKSVEGAFEYDQWNFISVVFDRASGKLKTYVNAEDVTDPEQSTLMTNFGTNAECLIGGFVRDEPVYTMNGWIDDLRIYGKKLTILEIEDLYFEFKPVIELSFEASDSEASEEGTDGATFTVTRSETDGDAVIPYTIEGSAMKSDYSPELSGSVTIPAGEASADITITPLDDDLYEGTETLTLVLQPSDVYTMTTSTSATVTIADNEDLPSDLYAYWPLNEGSGTTAEDLSGNGHTGTLGGNAAFSSDAVVGTSSVEFGRQTGDLIDVGTLELGNQFTISAWAKVVSNSNSIQTLFANYPGGNPDAGFAVYINEYSTMDKSVRVYAADGTNYDNGASDLDVIKFDEWNHVAVVVDKTAGTASIYVNGVDVTTDGDILTSFPTSGASAIGCYTSGNYAMNGLVDDVRIYSKALTASEVANIRNSSALSYMLSFQVYGEGTVSPGAGYYADGSTVNLVATPASGWKFLKWAGDAEGTDMNTSIVMDSVKTVLALFIKDQVLSGDTIAKINFTNGSVYDVDGWTNVYDTASFPVTLGNDVTLSLITGGRSIASGTSGEPINRFPGTVGSTYCYWHAGSTYTIKLVVSGLDTAEKYTFNMFGSRQNTITEDRYMQFAIEGTSLSEQLNTRGNAVNMVTFEDLSPSASGEIVLEMSNVDDKYGYVNTIVVTRDGVSRSENVKSLNNISYYPVPVTDRLYINNLIEGSHICTYDIAGRKVMECFSEGKNMTIDMKGMRSGIYFIKITDTHMNIGSFKIMKK